MKDFFRMSILLLTVLALLSYPSTIQTDKNQELIDLAREFVSLIVEGDFVGAVKNFDQTMSELSPPDKLREVWELVLKQVGPFIEQLGVRTEIFAQYDIVYVTCSFEKQKLDIKVVFDQEKKIAGQFFVPTQPQVEYEPPSYVLPKAFEDRPVTVGQGDWELPAILSLPRIEDNCPAVVLVHGSGPQDKDETIGPIKPFRDLAWGLASRGIAVLRYEKRTKAYGSKILSSPHLRLTVQEEVIDDCLQAVQLLKTRPEVLPDKIFVLGHSLGGTLVPRIAHQNSDIAGFIIMAGATRPLEDIVLDQIRYLTSLDGRITNHEQEQIDQIRADIEIINNLDSGQIESRRVKLLGAFPEYWLDLRNDSPSEMASSISRPLMVIQGGRDYQVTEEDFEGWKKALSGGQNVEFKLYPSLNHLFIWGRGKSSPEEYQKAGHVQKDVIEDISDWILKVAR